MVALGSAPEISNVGLTQYCNCMEEVKHRVGLVRSVLSGLVSTGYPAFNTETVFLQFRKILELVAFASLTANKDVYSAAYQEFATHWNAKRMLGYLEKVNADFYPIALEPFIPTANGVKHFPLASDGFMTKEEFVTLYNTCGKVLHARNPFSTEDPVIQIGYSVEQWVSRIQKLLTIHIISLDAATRNVQAVKSQASSADVPMPSQLEARLRAHLKKHDGKNELLFVNRRGRPFSANKLREKQLHPLLVKLGISHGGFHSMRHGAASSLLADGATPAVVQRQLRHSDARITLGLYGHVVGSQQRDAVQTRSSRLVN